MMELIRPDLNVPFVKNAKLFLTISGIVVGISVLLMLTMGINYGIDFSGGTEVQVRFNKPVEPEQIRKAVATMDGISAEVQRFGVTEENEYLIKLSAISFVNDEREAAIQKGLQDAYGDKGFSRFFHSTEGGDKVEFTLTERVQEDEIKAIFEKADSPINEVTVTGASGTFVYRTVLEGLAPHIEDALNQGIGAGSFEVLRLDSVGPKVGGELKQKGLLSIIYALIGILIYIAVRFDMRFAPGAVIALVHDIAITVGIFCLLQIEFTIPTIAALLTIVGYSLNDTIVVYDRIRENLSKAKVKPLRDVVNESINQTLSRTILTSSTTLLVVISLLFLGGGMIFDFAFALFIGVVVGTYSSIFIASPMMIYLYEYLDKRAAEAKAK
jgi:preprotein translocase subunit SecF